MTGWFFENMAWASLVMLAVLILRTPAARIFGAGPAYALWLLPAARLAMPPLPGGSELPALLPPLTLVVPVESGASVQAAGWSWTVLLLLGWAAGALAFLVWQWLAYRAFLVRLSLSSRSAGAHRGLPLVESAAVEGPLAVGLLDRRIVVPADFTLRYSAEERRLALEHERIHHVRGDIWWNLIALLFLAANWFNPLAWAAFRAFRADQELACDAAVAAAAAPAERADYAAALVKSASSAGMVAACPLNHADQLKRRLKMMKTHRTSRLRSIGGAAAVTILAAAAASLGAPGLAHPQPEGEGERKQHRIVILEKAGEGEHGAHARAERRNFVIRRGEGGEMELPEGCREGRPMADIDERSEETRTRILLCGQGATADAAATLEHLNRARERIAGNEEMGAEHRTRVLAAIDREIARLRAAQ